MRAFRLFALGVLVLLLAAASLPAQSNWSFRYYKEAVELTFYPLEIALYDPTPPVTLLPGERQVLLPDGNVATATDLDNGWSLVSLSIPGSEDPEGYTVGLLNAYATDPSDDVYAAPVFLDGPVRKFGKQEVHVGFEAGVPPATVDAVLQAAGVGTILDADWLRPGIHRVTGDIRSGIDLLDVANTLAMDPDVRFAQLNWRYMGDFTNVAPEPASAALKTRNPFFLGTGLNPKALAANCLPLNGESTPTDPLFYTSWFLEQFSNFDLDAVAAWGICPGDGTAMIAVLDDGILMTHPDLAGNVLPGIDTTEDCDVICDGSPQNNQRDYHGTNVAGVIVALAGNGKGTVGLAPNLKVVSVRVAKYKWVNGVWEHQAESSWVGRGLKWAATSGVRVTNMSLNFGYDEDALIHEGYIVAAEAGLMNFNSAGNYGSQRVMIPGHYPEVHSISAVDRNREKMNHLGKISNTGPDVAFSAPGQQILTTDWTGPLGWGEDTDIGLDYVSNTGTSLASPLVAALAGLIFAIQPAWTAEDVFEVLKKTAVDLGEPGRDDTYGYGFINAYAALQYAYAAVFSDGFESGSTNKWSSTTTNGA